MFCTLPEISSFYVCSIPHYALVCVGVPHLSTSCTLLLIGCTDLNRNHLRVQNANTLTIPATQVLFLCFGSYPKNARNNTCATLLQKILSVFLPISTELFSTTSSLLVSKDRSSTSFSSSVYFLSLKSRKIL